MGDQDHSTNIGFHQPLAIGFMIVGASIGFVVNLFVIYAVKKSRVFGASFGRLCISQSIGNCGGAAVFALLIPVTIIIDPALTDTYWGARAGQLLIFFWYGSLFTHVFSTLNRLCCITKPTKYATYFDARTTNVLIALSWFVGFLLVLPYFHSDCTLYWDMKLFSLQFKPSPCLPLVALYLDFYFNNFFVSLIFLIDVYTLVKVVQISKSSVGPNSQDKRRSRDIRFFLQTFSQAAIVITELTLYFYVSPLAENMWVKFFLTTFAWILLQLLDAVIVISFNKELRTLGLKAMGSSSNINATASSQAVQTSAT